MKAVLDFLSEHVVCRQKPYKTLMNEQDMDLTLQRVLLCPHDVNQGALQRVHVQAVVHPGPILRKRELSVSICAIQM